MSIYKIIAIIIVIILIIHTLYSFKVNNEINIIQMNNPNKNLMEENFRKKSPIIITGLMDKWNFIDKLKINNLKKQTIKIKINNSVIEQNNTKIIYKTIKDYIYWIENLEKDKNESEIKKFVSEKSINVYCAENENILQELNILSEIKDEVSSLLTPLSIINTYPIWIGHSHSRTGLHYDTDYRNLLCQIEGTKKIYLFPPEQTKYMYPSNKFDNGAVCSQVDFWNIDNKKFPEFNKSSYIEILLSPGQIISIPPYWWHAVENIGANVALSIRSEPFSNVVAKLPTGLTYVMHNLGIYKSNNCTCCNNEVLA